MCEKYNKNRYSKSLSLSSLLQNVSPNSAIKGCRRLVSVPRGLDEKSVIDTFRSFAWVSPACKRGSLIIRGGPDARGPSDTLRGGARPFCNSRTRRRVSVRTSFTISRALFARSIPSLKRVRVCDVCEAIAFKYQRHIFPLSRRIDVCVTFRRRINITVTNVTNLGDA